MSEKSSEEDTVAGEAASRSIGSKMRFIVGKSWMISPLIRHSFLLSSRTVFMFSIQIASTGPSKINHFLSGVCSATKHETITAILRFAVHKNPISWYGIPVSTATAHQEMTWLAPCLHHSWVD